MTTKLTLSVKQSVIQRAKVYAKSTGRSLSEIVEQHLDQISRMDEPYKLSPDLERIVGAVQLPADFDEETALKEVLEKKHL